jgi:hypothetical protein
MMPGHEPRLPLWEATDEPLELLHGRDARLSDFDKILF